MWWSQLGELGIRPDMTFDEAKRIRFANQVIFLLALPTLPLGIDLIWRGQTSSGVIQLLTATLMCIIPALNAKGWYQAARFILVVGANACILAMASTGGWWSGEHLILLLVILLIFALFDIRQYWSLSITVSLTLGNYVLMESGLLDTTGSHESIPADRSSYQLNYVLVLLSIILAVYYFKQLSSRQVDEIVKRAQQELKAVLNSSSMAIMVLDADMEQIHDCNDRAWGDFGFSDKKSLLAQPVSRLFHLGDQKFRHLDDHDTISEVEFVRADGSTFWGKVYFARVFYSGVDRLVMRVYDVTEKRMIKAALQQEQMRANKALQAKEYFLSMMSHELRTPIAGIAGVGHMLVDEDREELQEIGSMLKASSDRLLSTLSLILDIIQMDTLDSELEITEVKIEAMLEERMTELSALAREKGIGFSFEVCDKEHRVLANPVFLTQALNHLLMNAIKFTEEGGVKIYLDIDQFSSKTDLLWIIIRDTGVGMSKEFIENQLFCLFEQEKKGLDRVYQGVGLGMFFVKRALELMGGRIEVFSEKGQGTEVRLCLRLSRVLNLV